MSLGPMGTSSFPQSSKCSVPARRTNTPFAVGRHWMRTSVGATWRIAWWRDTNGLDSTMSFVSSRPSAYRPAGSGTSPGSP